nr:ABC transporter substrate-binding protein [Prevotella sp.]
MKFLLRYFFVVFAAFSGACAIAQTTVNPIRVGIMLPLHDNDGDGRRMIEYYRGFLMAVEDLKRQGTSVDVHAWNVPQDGDIVKTVMNNNETNKCDIIFGPLYSSQVKPLSYYCKGGDMKMVIPFSITSNEVSSNPNIFQIYQTPQELNSSAIYAFLNQFKNAHAVFVDCGDASSKKGVFTGGLRKKLEERGVKYSITSLKTSPDNFAGSFAKDKPNVVVLNTGRSPELTAVLNKLDTYCAQYPNTKISLYGYSDWLMYERYNIDRFFRYDTYIPSDSYFNASDDKTIELERRYRNNFHEDMTLAFPRFAITGYDQAMFFIQGLSKYGRNFTGNYIQNTYHSVQTPFKFNKVSNGGYRNRHFQLVHYRADHKMESINY